MIGAWGDAVPPRADGTPNLFQARAWDWEMDVPFRDMQGITVFHIKGHEASWGNASHSFVEIGVFGLAGALSGVNEAQLGLSQISVSYPDASFGQESRIGEPFLFLLKDMMLGSLTLDDAHNRMANTDRDCDNLIGVGDGKSREFRGFQFSHSVLNSFNDQNLEPVYPWHPRIKDVVYWGMDWLCPADNQILSDQIIKHYGNITAANVIADVFSIEQSGSNFVCLYDLIDLKMWVAFAPKDGEGGPPQAFDRQYTLLDIGSLFAEPPPTI